MVGFGTDELVCYERLMFSWVVFLVGLVCVVVGYVSFWLLRFGVFATDCFCLGLAWGSCWVGVFAGVAVYLGIVLACFVCKVLVWAWSWFDLLACFSWNACAISRRWFLLVSVEGFLYFLFWLVPFTDSVWVSCGICYFVWLHGGGFVFLVVCGRFWCLDGGSIGASGLLSMVVFTLLGRFGWVLWGCWLFGLRFTLWVVCFVGWDCLCVGWVVGWPVLWVGFLIMSLGVVYFRLGSYLLFSMFYLGLGFVWVCFYCILLWICVFMT